jgi:hypothetical protein
VDKLVKGYDFEVLRAVNNFFEVFWKSREKN